MAEYLLSCHYYGGFVFEGVIPDMYDIIGTIIAIIGVGIIYYYPREGENKVGITSTS